MSLEKYIMETIDDAVQVLMSKKLYTKSELGEQLSCSSRTIDKMIATREIKVHELIPGSPKTLRYDISEVLKKTLKGKASSQKIDK